jgi:hypothetical protein
MSRVVQLFASLALLCCLTGVVLPQEKPSAEDQAKLDRAQKVAEQFVEQFRLTLDFEAVWKEFHSSDISCAIHTTPGLPGFTGYELQEMKRWDRHKKMGLNDRLLERLYIASWNFYLLEGAYIYSLAKSKNGKEPDIESFLDKKTRCMKKIAIADKESKYSFGLSEGKESLEPRTPEEFEEYITAMNRIAAIFKQYMPRDALRTTNWRSAVKWFSWYHKPGSVNMGSPDWCLTEKDKIYGIIIGHFLFGFIEEKGEMKVLSMFEIDN